MYVKNPRNQKQLNLKQVRNEKKMNSNISNLFASRDLHE